MQEKKNEKINIEDIIIMPYPPVPITKEDIKKWEEEQNFRNKMDKIATKQGGSK